MPPSLHRFFPLSSISSCLSLLLVFSPLVFFSFLFFFTSRYPLVPLDLPSSPSFLLSSSLSSSSSSSSTPLLLFQNRDSFVSNTLSSSGQGLPWDIRSSYLNVTSVWDQGIQGQGIVVAIVDDGVDYTNEDLKDRYASEFSYDFIDDDMDPMPNSTTPHGTQSAGVVAASENQFCGVGVAPKVTLAALRINQESGEMAPKLSEAFTYRFESIHIYSNSWGPSDTGYFIDGPSKKSQRALKKAVSEGRKGLGNIFVFAAGNGKVEHDDCNYDGYVNSFYTIAIAAVHAGQESTSYSEACTAILISAFSSFGYNDNVTGMLTTSVGADGCTKKFGGTSAAAPMVSGVIALMLQVRPELTWRDVMGVLVHYASPINPFHHSWQSTFGKLRYSREYGFGIVNAGLMVEGAKQWPLLPKMSMYTLEWKFINTTWTKDKGVFIQPLTVPEVSVTQVYQVEQVILMVELEVTGGAGFLMHSLESPSNLKSQLTETRPLDYYSRKLTWNFTSVEFWGETKVQGEWVWKMEISNSSVSVNIGACRLVFLGSSQLPNLALSTSTSSSSSSFSSSPSFSSLFLFLKFRSSHGVVGFFFKSKFIKHRSPVASLFSFFIFEFNSWVHDLFSLCLDPMSVIFLIWFLLLC